MISSLRTVLGVLLAAGALAGAALVASAPAAAATPCWKTLLNDWYDGRIDHTYPISCYHQALRHLPSDVQTYSSAKDDIARALQDALAANAKAHKPTKGGGTLVPPQTTPRPPSGGGGSRGGPAATTAPTTTTTTSAAPTTSLPGNQPRGGISKLADDLNPSSPSSVPLPLLVLGGLALVLVAAGGVGLLLKRRQNGP